MNDRTDDLSHAKRLFADALAITPEQRSKMLEAACGDDAVLRAEVEELLAIHEGSSDFLARPTVGLDGAERLSEALSPPEDAGTTIDRYRLLERIGEGGFGVVFMAQQTEPVRRRVAFKILRPGMVSGQVIARFEAERQALALMDHPNIARVFDAGTTPSGRPYFVMELVRGEPITTFCDREGFGMRERIELFRDVCLAVQHAHHKGVIHRDIKPSNVLVTVADGRPMVKVIDFGIAKAIDVELTQRTLFTEFRQLIGTPEYMSPEQAERSGVDIDTRSDVYSLGVLLYELLTGTTPIDGGTLRSAGYARMQELIVESIPQRPSDRVSTLGNDANEIAKRRGVARDRLGPLMRGEIDWIVMRALEKDRSRRYDSPGALAADAKRWLDDEPVEATPPSVVHRVRGFVRRHRTLVATASIVAIALSAGLVAATIGFFRAERAFEREAAARLDLESALVQLERETDAQRAVSDFLADTLTAADPWTRPRDRAPLARDLLDEAARRLDAGALGGNDAVETRVRAALGRAYQTLGASDRAVEYIAPVLDRLLESGEDPRRVAQTASLLATNFDAALDPRGITSIYERAITELDAADPPRATDAIATRLELAQLLHFRNDYRTAEAVLRETLDRADEILGSGSPESLAAVMNLASAIATDDERRDEAALLYDRATAGYADLLVRGEFEALGRLASWLVRPDYDLFDPTDIASLGPQVFRAFEQLGRDRTPSPNEALIVLQLADTLGGMGQPLPAAALFDRGVELLERSLAPTHWFVLQWRVDGQIPALLRAGREDDAIAIVEEMANVANGPSVAQFERHQMFGWAGASMLTIAAEGGEDERPERLDRSEELLLDSLAGIDRGIVEPGFERMIARALARVSIERAKFDPDGGHERVARRWIDRANAVPDRNGPAPTAPVAPVGEDRQPGRPDAPPTGQRPAQRTATPNETHDADPDGASNDRRHGDRSDSPHDGAQASRREPPDGNQRTDPDPVSDTVSDTDSDTDSDTMSDTVSDTVSDTAFSCRAPSGGAPNGGTIHARDERVAR